MPSLSPMARSAACVAFILALAGAAQAQSSLGIGTAEVTMQPGSGPLAGLFLWIAGVQREFFTALRHALIDMRSNGGGFGFLVGLSFVYGVFHAAGPGHGKAVVSSYILANKVQLRRGIALSFLAAGFQAASAMLLVGAGWYLLRGTAISMTRVGSIMELASYALIAAFGAWLLVRKLVALGRTLRLPERSGQLAFAPAGRFSSGPAATGGSGFRAEGLPDGACTEDEAACDCGRAHMPDPARLSAPQLGIGAAVATALAIGLRPCAGAIVVLTFSLVNGLWLAGGLSVLAMAFGTAITVSVLAALSVYAKGFAMRFSGRSAFVGQLLEVAGALLLLLFGLLLLGGALQA